MTRPADRDLPLFDRRFFGGAFPFTRIGGGALGGKAAGLCGIRDVLARAIDPAAFDGMTVAVPTMAVIATDHFDAFVDGNRLRDLPFDTMSDDRIAHAFHHGETPVELVGDLRALITGVHTPLAVRSSSLLEDAQGRPFAGVYATKMIPNDAYDPDIRFRKLIEAIKFVWASTFFREARDYIRATGQDPAAEKMAVIVQEVVGSRRGERFYPALSGVARSYNFYPLQGARPEDGVVSLALGLGKTIVDGGTAWSYSPSMPKRTPPFGSINDWLSHTQTSFWTVRMGPPKVVDPASEVEYMEQANLADAERDGTLRYVASTYDGARDRLVPGLGAGIRGPRVITFAPLLQTEEFPLNRLVRALLAACEAATGAKVEIEFAGDFAADPQAPHGARPSPRLGFLQVRALAVSSVPVDVPDGLLEDPAALVASRTVLGNGSNDTLSDVIYVRPSTFDVMATPRIAQEIARINRALVEAGRRCVLIGFGRWGSSHASLGIPVDWSQVASARAIVETTLPQMNVEPSQGSHFFHNLQSFDVVYFTLHHETGRPVDFAWLDAQPAETGTEHIRHVRLATPLRVRVDGRTGRGVILRSP